MEEKRYDYTNLKMKTSIRFQLMIMCCLNFGQIIVGYSVGWSSPTVPKLQNAIETPLPETITTDEGDKISSLLYVGAIIGPYVTGILSNLIGRKPCLLLGGILNITSYVIMVSTKTVYMIYVLRLIGGLGMGITTVCNLVYVGEIASTNIRGILLTSTSIVGISGTLLVYCVVPFVSYNAAGYLALIISLIHLVSVWIFVPESPVYNAMKGKEVQATKTLNDLGRSDDTQRVLDTFGRNKASSNIKDWTEIFTIKCNRMSLLITFTLGSLQQTSGVTAVLFSSTDIFAAAGSSITPYIATIIIGVTRLVSSIIAPTFIERIGRKFLLLISTAACAVSLTILGFHFYFQKMESSIAELLGWLPLVALMIYFFSYECGFGTIPSAIVGEMFRANVRSNGSALAITLTWLVGFFLTRNFNNLQSWLGSDVTFWMFGGSCVVAFLFTLFLVPETKGKTLKEIQDMMS